jgi:uncharacterized membrane protein YhfC
MSDLPTITTKVVRRKELEKIMEQNNKKMEEAQKKLVSNLLVWLVYGV